MAIRTFRPYTPGTRTRVVTDFNEVTERKPERSLVISKHRRKGRNNRGVITCRHRGGGHKRLYRLVDFRRDKHGITAKVAAIHYDPHRNARLLERQPIKMVQHVAMNQPHFRVADLHDSLVSLNGPQLVWMVD